MKVGALLAIGFALCCPASTRADDPMPVTSDTPAYCLSLAARMEAKGDMTPEVRRLWQEGTDLCKHGHVRSGLSRLRRAVMITHGVGE